MKVTGVIIVLITSAVSKHFHNSLRRSALKFKGDFFNILNKDVHDIVENIFKCLNLVTDFTKNPNMLLLLKMHYDLNNIINKNFDAFNEIQNTTKVNENNFTESMVILNKAVDEVFTENNFSVYGYIRGKKHKHARNKAKTKNKSTHVNTSEFEDSDEFNDFVLDFVKKVDKLSVKDFTLSSKPIRRPVSFRRNLKIWEPSSSLEEMNFSNNTYSRRVFRGTSTTVKRYAFMVSIHIMGEFVCAGSIISRDLIITAASCLESASQNNFLNQNPNAVYVRIGSDYTMRDGEVVPVQELYFHPSYRSRSLRHNLALIKLEKRIRFTREKQKVRRILWDKTPENLDPNVKSIVIVGWGATKADQKMKPFQKLTVDALDTYPIRECSEIYSKRFVTVENFCAGFTKSRGGACNGDIGAPGIDGAILTGIVSFGAPVCGTIGAPTVFTKIGYYTPWIESIMGTDRTRRGLFSFTRRQQRDLFNYQPSLYAQNHTILLFRGNDEYPDEVKALKSILQELVQSDSTVVDELLYGELYDDFNDLFGSNETNQSYNNDETIELTTSSTSLPTYTKKKQSFRKPASKSKDTQEENMDYTDNYEASTEEIHGMSIEVKKPKESSKDGSLQSKSYEKSADDSEEEISHSVKKPVKSEENSSNENKSAGTVGRMTKDSAAKSISGSDGLSIKSDKQAKESSETNEHSSSQDLSYNILRGNLIKKQLPHLHEAKEKRKEGTRETKYLNEEIKKVVNQQPRTEQKEEVIKKLSTGKTSDETDSSSADETVSNSYATTPRKGFGVTEMNFQSREMKFKLFNNFFPKKAFEANFNIKHL